MSAQETQTRDIYDLDNVEIRKLTKGNAPPYIHIVQADNYGDAVEEMVRSVYKAPVNTAVWLGLTRLFNAETREFIRYWNKNRKTDIWESPEQVDAKFLNAHFKTYAEEFPKIDEHRVGRREFLRHMQFFRNAIRCRFNDTTTHVEVFPKNVYNSMVWGASQLHTDPLNALFLREKITNIREQPEHHFRFLLCSKPGTWLANPKNWKRRGREVTGFADAAGDSPKPVIYEAPEFALVMLTGKPWYHPASLHGAPVQKSNREKNLDRFRFICELKIPARHPA